jgi:hypothetical protein
MQSSGCGAVSVGGEGCEYEGEPMPQIRVARGGALEGQGRLWAATLGLPKSWRHAATRALTGFQFAMARSQVGMPAVGTKALETMAMGKVSGEQSVGGGVGFRARSPR